MGVGVVSDLNLLFNGSPFSWGGNLISGPRFKQARLPRGVHWVFTNVSHDLCGPKNQPATLCVVYEQIFERTRFSLIVNSENSWAGLVPRRVWSVNLSLMRGWRIIPASALGRPMNFLNWLSAKIESVQKPTVYFLIERIHYQLLYLRRSVIMKFYIRDWVVMNLGIYFRSGRPCLITWAIRNL